MGRTPWSGAAELAVPSKVSARGFTPIGAGFTLLEDAGEIVHPFQDFANGCRHEIRAQVLEDLGQERSRQLAEHRLSPDDVPVDVLSDLLHLVGEAKCCIMEVLEVLRAGSDRLHVNEIPR
jgi:hypothetical protein